MPNFFSAFTSEVFRPLVTLLIPGAIAISTWFIALLWHFEGLRDLVYKNHGETGLVLLLAMICAGLVLEDIGAHVETFLDKRKDKADGKHSDNWNKYLRTAFKADPIGRRYIRALVLRLKFELGTAFAALNAGFGLVWLSYLGLGFRIVFVCGLLCALFAALLLIEACSTHQALADNRANLLGDIRIIPPPKNNEDDV